jgi:hypothetical protein
MTSEIDEFLSNLADELDRQADGRRERAIIADQQRGGSVPDEVVERWASSFATAYQTLRGAAAAIRAALAKAHRGSTAQ